MEHLVDGAVKDLPQLSLLLCLGGLRLPAVPLSGSGPFSLGTYPCPQQAPFPPIHGAVLCWSVSRPTRMTTLTPHGRIGLPRPSSAHAATETSAKSHSVIAQPYSVPLRA